MSKTLPAGWEEKTLGEICEIIAGQSPESSFYNQEKIGLPFYQGKKEFSSKYIKPAITWTIKITKIALKGDILMSVRAPVGPVNYATEKCCIGRGLAAIRPKKGIETDFIFYFLQSIEKEIAGHDGTVFNSISRKEIEKISILIPPLSEQKRIVEKLDKIFANIDKAKENTKKNLQNAKEVFESYLHSLFSNINCEHKKLSQVVNIIGGGTPAKSNEEYYTGNIPWATVRDMNVEILRETEFKITKEAVRESATNIIPKNNVIIATRVGLGKACVLNMDTAINQDLKGLIPKSSLNTKFLYWWYCSIKEKVIEAGVGATVKGVKIPFIQGLDFPHVDLKTQGKIVSIIDKIRAKTQELEQIYTKKLADLDELKQSILQQAFSGKL